MVKYKLNDLLVNMKICVASSGDIPSQWAHGINIVKHAQGFYDLGHEVNIYTVKRLYEDISNLRVSNIQKLYGINSEIKIESFRDTTFFYFKDIIPKLLNFFTRINKFNLFSKNFIDPERRVENNTKSQIPILKLRFQHLKTNFYISDKNDPEKKISKSCKKNEIDFCYSRAYRTIYYNIQNEIPSVLETHEAHVWKPHIQHILTLNNNKYFKGIVTISDVLKDEYIKVGISEEKILVIEDAVDISIYDSIDMNKSELRKYLGLPNDKIIIMYTGSLFKGRGIETIIDAASILGDDSLIFLLIGGTIKEINYWRKYRSKKKKQFNIEFLGFIQNVRIPFYHKAADILIAPYTSSCRTVEWMSPIKVFEYMASMVPIIASDVQRVKEICNNEECILFKQGDSLNLADMVKKLISNKNLRFNLAQKAYATARKYTYKKRCNKILSFFMN